MRRPRGVAVFRLRDHIERLATTCDIVGLPLDYAVEELVDACAETVRLNAGAKSVKISALIPSGRGRAGSPGPRAYRCSSPPTTATATSSTGTPANRIGARNSH